MSSPRLRVVLSPEAETDLEDILFYTQQQHGETQRERYRDRLIEAILRLAEHPHMGTSRPELPRDVRVFPVERHRIFYRVIADTLQIARVLHARMDTKRHL